MELGGHNLLLALAYIVNKLNLPVLWLVRIIFLTAILSSCSVGKRYDNNDNEFSTAITGEIEDGHIAYSNAPQADLEDCFEFRNPWHKEYFHNDWGEDDTAHPMLVTHIIGESLWNLRIEYIPPTEDLPLEWFRVFITEDGNITSMYGPAEILVRGSDGETHNVEVSTVEDYAAYIGEPSSVNILKYYLNQDQFDIRINFEKWNERHHTQGRWWSDAGYFQRAINTML